MSGFNDSNSAGILPTDTSAFLSWQGKSSLPLESKSQLLPRNRSNTALAMLQEPLSEHPTTTADRIHHQKCGFWDPSCYPGLFRRTGMQSFQEGKKDPVFFWFQHYCVMCRRQQSTSRNQLSWKNSQIFHEQGSHFQLSKGTNVSWIHYFWHLKMPGFKKVQ